MGRRTAAGIVKKELKNILDLPHIYGTWHFLRLPFLRGTRRQQPWQRWEVLLRLARPGSRWSAAPSDGASAAGRQGGGAEGGGEKDFLFLCDGFEIQLMGFDVEMQVDRENAWNAEKFSARRDEIYFFRGVF